MKKIFIAILSLFLVACSKTPTPIFESKDELKIVVASDLHYYAKELFEECSWFGQALLYEDGQMIHYTHLIVEHFVDEVSKQNPDLVLITGDLTYNGEKLSHESLSNCLAKFEEVGIDVAVINGNHDVANQYAYKYTEKEAKSTDNITSEDFKTIYKDLGYDIASSTDENSLSYHVPLNKDYDLLVIDTCATDSYRTGSKISEDTMTWIEDQLKNSNKKTIVAMHHNVLIHCKAIYSGYTLDNHDEMEALFKKYDVPLVLSGHIHTQHIQNSDNLYEIASNALSIAPIQYGVIILNSDTIDYEVKEIQNVVGDEAFFKAASYNKSVSQLSPYFNEEETSLLAAYFAEINLQYFAGNSYTVSEKLKNDDLYDLLKTKEEDLQFIIKYIDEMLSETKSQQKLHIDL